MHLNLYFLLFEVLVLILFFWCLKHAVKEGELKIFQLIFGVLFGVTLEIATIKQLNAYSYGEFLIMIMEVPLAVGIGWGIIIYSAMLTSDKTSLPWFIRPFLDGLLALNIDLAMDALAIRLDMWDWGKGFSYEYFGVPFANFWAWFWVTFFFSAGFRLLNYFLSDKFNRRKYIKLIKNFFIASAAFFVGLAGVLITNWIIVYKISELLKVYVIAALLISSIFIVIFFKPKIKNQDEPLTFWIPFGFHIYFLLAGIISEVIFSPVFLLYVSFIMLIISLLLHKKYITQIVKAD